MIFFFLIIQLYIELPFWRCALTLWFGVVTCLPKTITFFLISKKMYIQKATLCKEAQKHKA